jgi:trimeric autotransporter adhesin
MSKPLGGANATFSTKSLVRLSASIAFARNPMQLLLVSMVQSRLRTWRRLGMNYSQTTTSHEKVRLALVLGASLTTLVVTANTSAMADDIKANGATTGAAVKTDGTGLLGDGTTFTGLTFGNGTTTVDVNATDGVKVTGGVGDTTTSITKDGVVIGTGTGATTIQDKVFTTDTGVASTFKGTAAFQGATTFGDVVTNVNGNSLVIDASGKFQQTGNGTGAGRSITLDATNDIANFTGMTVTIQNAGNTSSTNILDGKITSAVTGGGSTEINGGTVVVTGTYAGNVAALTALNASTQISGGAIINNGLQVNGGATITGQTTVSNFAVTPTSTVDMGGNRVQNVGTPTAANDAANKAYVDTLRNWTTANFSKVNSGIAAAAALANPDRTGNQTWALAVNEGFWNGHSATGFSGITRVANLGTYDFSVGGSVAVTDHGDVAGRVSAQIAGGGAPAPLK